MELAKVFDIIFSKNHTIDEVAIEDIFYAFNPKTVLNLPQFSRGFSFKSFTSDWKF